MQQESQSYQEPPQYVCARCGNITDQQLTVRPNCSACGYNVLMKKRTRRLRLLKAR